MSGSKGCCIRLVFLTGLLSWQVTMAQPSTDNQKRYKTAVQLVRSGDYEKAKTELNLLIQRDGPLSPYAHYYYALAAFRQKNFPQAQAMLKQLQTRFSDWNKVDDAQYLLAAVSMEMGRLEDGVAALQSISDAKIRAEGIKLEQAFIGRITDLKRLKALNKEFPDDRAVGLALIDLLQQTATDKEDLELSDRLTNRFGVPNIASTRSTAPVSATPSASATSVPVRANRAKGYYNVALLFPFRLDEFDAEKRARTNQYVYDLYNGIKMAKTKLQEEGITVNLFAYDIENDANKTLELVNSPAFAQTDLMIGPLYVEPNRIASAYASQNSILLLNPIATNSDLVANQPMAFLAQPSLNQQAQQAAKQAASLIRSEVKVANDLSSRRVAIYFGTSRKDSLLALAYQTEMQRQNYQVVDFRKLSGTAQAMADAMLQQPGSTTRPVNSSQVAGATLGHIFFASSSDTDGQRLLDALSRKKINGPVMATSTAFDMYSDATATFTKRNLYLLYPDFIDVTREPVVTFQEQYVAKRNTIPSVFASQGYDMMLFFGRQLAKNGSSLRNRSMLRSDTDDYLLSGFDYTQTNDNQIVPIVKFTDGRLVKIE
ncbi:tetratricopeptide repeat protein [Spirosoma sp. BT702]|uniref:Tetratricopeptide repeat protein n=1 Tax=Spirosoma profusum TaxID=2771354 RepID=A0A926Y1G4_9BACT|nr:tetratricopeptide repeat protein [Spirosoma profusum]MBD2704266.1 tetratricopeptide repeat protein [Spirosoma profusum]